MSSTAYVCSIGRGATTRYFAAARTEGGAIPDVPELEQEVLRDYGIDGVRWRDDSLQFRQFRMETVEDLGSDADGVAVRRQYQGLRGKFVTMKFIRAGRTLVYKNVKVEDVEPVLVAGPLIGYGSDGDGPSYCTLTAMWSLRLTEVAS